MMPGVRFQPENKFLQTICFLNEFDKFVQPILWCKEIQFPTYLLILLEKNHGILAGKYGPFMTDNSG